MKDEVKTSIVVDRRLREEFKLKVSGEKGLKKLSKAVEEAIKEEVSELLIAKALKEMFGSKKKIPLSIVPIEPHTSTDAGKVVREIRDLPTANLFKLH